MNIEFVKNEIVELIQGDNGCEISFEYVRNNIDNSLKSIKVFTFNPKKEETFLLLEVACNNEEAGINHIHGWVVSHIAGAHESSYTVLWSKRNIGTNTTYKSYFYGRNMMDVLAKFYYGKDEKDYMVYEIKINPIA